MSDTTTAPAKGPLVFLDYDQESLDRAYNQAAYAPNMQEVLAGNAAASDDFRRRRGEPRRLSYGPTDIEGIDLFPANRANARMLVYIHGGGWRLGTARNSEFLAEPYIDAGAHVLALDFTGVERTEGSLTPIADQVRRAVAWIYRNASSFDGDPNRLYVVGLSSGAHLTSVVLTTDWQKEFGLPANVVKGALCASGMYDLYPVSLSARSSYVKFTPEIIAALSAIKHLDKINCPVVVAHGDRETPEFQRQNRDFAAALQKAGKTSRLVVVPGHNHFEMTRSVAKADGLLGSALLELIGLKRV